MDLAALGLRAHSGWAALVAVAGAPRAPAAVLRRRLELADPAIPGSAQPYHAAEGLELAEAQAIVDRCAEGARRLAGEAFQAVLRELREAGHEAVGCGLLLASGRTAPSLQATLASHALIHTADGELFRDALAHAAERNELPLLRVKEHDVFARAAAALGVRGAELPRRLVDLGRPLGSPWRQDEKLAALVAWLSLAERSR